MQILGESFQCIKVESEQSHVVKVTLQRPDLRNAFNPLMIDELTRVFRDHLNRDTTLRVVVLQGAGKSFCSGADLAWMQSMVNYTLEENKRDSEKLFDLFAVLRACPVPLLGRLQGHVMGGGVGLAAVCDIAAAESKTSFGFSEARLGLAPAVISPFVLEKMQASYAHRYFLTAEMFSASEALASGLLHFVGDIDAVDTYIAQIAKTICENGPEAVRASKVLLRRSLPPSYWAEAKTETTRIIAERRVGVEGQEGLRGFLEKRTPSWRGS